MVAKAEVARRFVLAHIHLMSQIGTRVTLSALAERMSRAHGKRSFSQGQVTEYQRGKTSPTLEAIWAYAKATGVDPGWLAFGEESSAHVPATSTLIPEVVKGVAKSKRKRA